MVRPEGLEPPTLWFEARCSIQLSYGRTVTRETFTMPLSVESASGYDKFSPVPAGGTAGGLAKGGRVVRAKKVPWQAGKEEGEGSRNLPGRGDCM